MGNEKAKYNIKAICTMLGIQPGTLRAWERRYNIIEPIRNESGHRLYSDEHVAILSWLLDKVNKGFTIGQAVGLLEKGSIPISMEIENQIHQDRAQSIAHKLKEALLSFQETKANKILDEAFSIFSLEKVLIDIIGNVLTDIGHLWENDQISIANEHYVSQFLRTKIGMIFHHLETDPLLPKVVAICGPNERHELGLFIFTLFLRRKGYEVIYLGTGIPVKDLQLVVTEVQPKYLFLSCTLEQNLSETLSVIEEMKVLDKDMHIGLGGNGTKYLSKRKKEQYQKHLVGFLKDDWEEWLKSTLVK